MVMKKVCSQNIIISGNRNVTKKETKTIEKYKDHAI